MSQDPKVHELTSRLIMVQDILRYTKLSAEYAQKAQRLAEDYKSKYNCMPEGE